MRFRQAKWLIGSVRTPRCTSALARVSHRQWAKCARLGKLEMTRTRLRKLQREAAREIRALRRAELDLRLTEEERDRWLGRGEP